MICIQKKQLQKESLCQLLYTIEFYIIKLLKAVANGGTFLTYGKKLPQHLVFEEADHKTVEWTTFLKEKNLKLKALCQDCFPRKQ